MEIIKLHYPNDEALSNIEPSAAALGFFDGLHLGHIDVIDMHSWNKPDAPSGTAKELGEEMAKMSPDKTYEDITFHSLRSGNIPSTHKVVFGCMGERLEITHDAFDWSCFAEGRPVRMLA